MLFAFPDLQFSLVNIQVPEDFRRTEENMQAEDDE